MELSGLVRAAYATPKSAAAGGKADGTAVNELLSLIKVFCSFSCLQAGFDQV